MPTTGIIERDVKKALKAYLTEIGAYQYWPVPTGYGKKGVDVFFCHRGLFFAVETKRPGGVEPTTAQRQVLREVAAASGGVCLENDPRLIETRHMVHAAPARVRALLPYV